jgi:hypothetical protein
MKGVELYGRVRYAVQIEGLSHRAAARRFGIDPRTVAKRITVKLSRPRAPILPAPKGRTTRERRTCKIAMSLAH